MSFSRKCGHEVISKTIKQMMGKYFRFKNTTDSEKYPEKLIQEIDNV